ncbi:MAG: CHAD domain-containing protein [Stellaceae bacterium]
MSEATFQRLDATADGLDTDAVHHFRTAIRRLRSLLSAFKPLLPPGKRKTLSRKLKRLSQHYAQLRDWDVLIAALTKGASASDRKKFADVAEMANECRATAAARHLVLAEDIRAVTEALAAADWLDAPSPGETESWNQPIGDFAADLFDRQRRKMRKGARDLDLDDPASFHQFRIAAKKHRYAIEFLTPLYGKKKSKDYLARVVAIQDVLGDMRDALTARSLVTKLRLPAASRSLGERWLERRGARCRKRFPVCDRAFRRKTPFWEH